MPLSDAKLRTIKPTGKEYQLADGGGLVLVVRAKGAMAWRYEYRVNGKKEKLPLGNYPFTGLAEARRLHLAAKEKVKHGISPIEEFKKLEQAKQEERTKQEEHESRTRFGEAAERYRADWLERKWKDPAKAWGPIKLHLLPVFGARPLDDITASDVRNFLYGIRERNGEQAAIHAHGWLKRIFAHAVEHELGTSNPAALVNGRQIGSRTKRKRYLSTAETKHYLAQVYQSSTYRGYKLGLHLLLMLGLRLNEVAGANWCEIDLDAAEWRIPHGRMKSKRDHTVLLPQQAVELLKELHALGGGSAWLFPMRTNPAKPMHGNNLGGVHRSICTSGGIADYHLHDHRHTASTHLHEMGYPPDVINAALAHAVGGIRGVYNNAEYKEQRRAMLQAWADHLDALGSETTVIRAVFRRTA